MKIQKQMKLSFLSKSVNESFARTAVAAFITGLDPTMDEIIDIKTAVSEAVTNCIVHAYRDSVQAVYITAATYPDNRVVIKVSDKGCGIEDVEKAMEPLYTTCPDGERAGLGFALMQSLCDKVRVVSKPGKGTSVTLYRKLAMRGQDDAQE